MTSGSGTSFFKAISSQTPMIDRVTIKNLIQQYQGLTSRADSKYSDSDVIAYAHSLGIPGYEKGSGWINSPTLALIGEGRVPERVVRQDQYGGGITVVNNVSINGSVPVTLSHS